MHPFDPPSSSRPTILIVGYRAYSELDRCLASLAMHEPAVPVVVVDHEADLEAGQALAARYPRMTYVPCTSNGGFAAGVNLAARHAAPGAHLLLLNPDCVLSGPVVGQLTAVLDAHSTAGVVGGVLLEPEGALQRSARRFPDVTTAFAGRTSWLSRHLPGNALSRRNLSGRPSAPTVVDWVTGAFALIRRETFDAVGGFDQGFFLYWEDADFCRRAGAAGWTTMYAPTTAVIHGTARSSVFAPVRALVAFHRSAWRYYWKHGSWLARVASPVVAAGLCGRFLMKLSRQASAPPRPVDSPARHSRVRDARA